MTTTPSISADELMAASIRRDVLRAESDEAKRKTEREALERYGKEAQDAAVHILKLDPGNPPVLNNGGQKDPRHGKPVFWFTVEICGKTHQFMAWWSAVSMFISAGSGRSHYSLKMRVVRTIKKSRWIGGVVPRRSFEWVPIHDLADVADAIGLDTRS